MKIQIYYNAKYNTDILKYYNTKHNTDILKYNNTIYYQILVIYSIINNM